jgi:Zn finger protein HypA/HybF involved in hydrogenase expression
VIAYNAADFLEAVTERQYREAAFIDTMTSGCDAPTGINQYGKTGECVDCHNTKRLVAGRRVCPACHSARQIARKRAKSCRA